MGVSLHHTECRSFDAEVSSLYHVLACPEQLPREYCDATVTDFLKFHAHSDFDYNYRSNSQSYFTFEGMRIKEWRGKFLCSVKPERLQLLACQDNERAGA